MVPQLPLFPVFNVRRVTLPEVVVPFPLGIPKTRVRQGVLGEVGDNSWEGCGPFSVVGPAQNPCQPALSQALTISQPPPLGRTNPLVSPWGSHPQTWTQLCTRLPKGTPYLVPLTKDGTSQAGP